MFPLAGVHGGPGVSDPYRYTHQLLQLAKCTPVSAVSLPSSFAAITTPLLWRQWERALQSHSDGAFVRFIVDGISQGFRIGFDHRKRSNLRACSRNMWSANEHAEVVSNYIADELVLKRIVGPFVSTALGIHCSSFGVIPKQHQPNKWRLIVDLSSPHGASVNDGIDRELCSLVYISVADIAAVVMQLGRGSLLAKSDVKSAYRQIPVHPDDRSLLGMRWQGQLFCDATLPFGLRSAPIIFSAVADALEWVVKARGGTHIFHYVDDFVFVGPPRSPKCSRDLQLFVDTCSELGIELAVDKTEGPSTCLTILGIEIDTMAMELRLPQAKLARLAESVRSWRGKRSGKRREFESLVGLLQHASQVVRPGRIFLRRLYSLLASTSAFKPHYTIRLNSEAQADIEWWSTFVQRWN